MRRLFLDRLVRWGVLGTLLLSTFGGCGGDSEDAGEDGSGGGAATGGAASGGSKSGGSSSAGGRFAGGASGSGGQASGGTEAEGGSGSSLGSGGSDGGNDPGTAGLGGETAAGGEAPGGAGGVSGSGGQPGGCDCDSPSILVCGEDGVTYDAGCGATCVPVAVACQGECPCDVPCSCVIEGRVDSQLCTGTLLRCEDFRFDEDAFDSAGCENLPTGAIRYCCPDEPPIDAWCPL